tara:strand:- start:353 stop:1261 length:909 start_codon:yes stop_codon:yes gene_type:complete
MKTIKINSEFASEMVCAVPYAYWLHKKGELKKIITSKDMKPFYYFCDNVQEDFEYRTLDNKLAGLNELPNSWVHGTNPMEYPGVLDYSQWSPPPYAEHYKTSDFDSLKPYVVINNNFNIEFGMDISKSLRYFNIETLYEMFNHFNEKGYNVIYKRPDNTEFTLDQNEINTLNAGYSLNANVEGIGKISDYELTDYYDNVHLIDTIVHDSEKSYNETQLKLFSNAEGFITTNGGGGVLCSYFGKDVIMYVPHGKELRDSYLTNKDSYINKLSNNNVHVILDPGDVNNYEKLINKVKEIFNETN